MVGESEKFNFTLTLFNDKITYNGKVMLIRFLHILNKLTVIAFGFLCICCFGEKDVFGACPVSECYVTADVYMRDPDTYGDANWKTYTLNECGQVIATSDWHGYDSNVAPAYYTTWYWNGYRWRVIRYFTGLTQTPEAYEKLKTGLPNIIEGYLGDPTEIYPNGCEDLKCRVETKELIIQCGGEEGTAWNWSDKENCIGECAPCYGQLLLGEETFAEATARCSNLGEALLFYSTQVCSGVCAGSNNGPPMCSQ